MLETLARKCMYVSEMYVSIYIFISMRLDLLFGQYASLFEYKICTLC